MTVNMIPEQPIPTLDSSAYKKFLQNQSHYDFQKLVPHEAI